MTAPTIFAKQAGEGESDTDKHQWGGTIGGPIVRDKLHFFSSFERYVVGTGLTNVFPTRPELNWSAKEGLNGRNYMIRVDHQINANNTYTARYLTERQPNRDLLTGDRATLSTGELRARHRPDGQRGLQPGHRHDGAEHAPGVDRDGGHPARARSPETSWRPIARISRLPCSAFLSFDEQGHTNGQHRNAQAPGLDNTFSWFVPGKGGDHDLKFGFQYLYARNELSEQGSMNGVFTFPGDRPFNAADPSTYPERLSIRVPVPAGVTSFTHSFGYYAQDKWRVTPKLTLNLGLRYDVDIFPFASRCNPLARPSEYPVDKNNFQPRAGFAYNVDGRSVIRGGIGTLLREVLHRSGLAASGHRRVRQVVHRQLPGQSARSGPEQWAASDRSDARQRPGREPNAAQPALSRQALSPRNTGTVQLRFARSTDAEIDAGVVWLRAPASRDDVVWGRLHPQRGPQLDRVRPESRLARQYDPNRSDQSHRSVGTRQPAGAFAVLRTSSIFASITPAKPDTMVSTFRWSGGSRLLGRSRRLHAGLRSRQQQRRRPGGRTTSSCWPRRISI